MTILIQARLVTAVIVCIFERVWIRIVTQWQSHPRLGTDVVHYVYNNAGIAGGNSFLDESPEGRAAWERTFDVDWYGSARGAAANL